MITSVKGVVLSAVLIGNSCSCFCAEEMSQPAVTHGRELYKLFKEQNPDFVVDEPQIVQYYGMQQQHAVMEREAGPAKLALMAVIGEMRGKVQWIIDDDTPTRDIIQFETTGVTFKTLVPKEYKRHPALLWGLKNLDSISGKMFVGMIDEPIYFDNITVTGPMGIDALKALVRFASGAERVYIERIDVQGVTLEESLEEQIQKFEDMMIFKDCTVTRLATMGVQDKEPSVHIKDMLRQCMRLIGDD